MEGFHVKHLVPVGLTESLQSELADLGLQVSPAQQEWMLEYLLSLLEANSRINLTRITDPEDAIRLHLVDSLTVLPELHDAPPGAVLDIGSGGGFPGVPLAAATGRDVVLLDSVAKKMTAVASVLDLMPALCARITLSSRRAEQLSVAPGEGFAVVVARAVAPLPSLVELAAPLLLKGGLLVALKGSPEEAEFTSGSAVAVMVGLRETGRRKLALPNSGELRTIVVYEKIGRASVNLPRRTGLAQNSPLA